MRFFLLICYSDWADFEVSSQLKPVIPETDAEIAANPQQVRRLVFCSGKVYYDLVAQREQRQDKELAIVRIEELSPFPFHLVDDEISRYPNAEVVWCQEGNHAFFMKFLIFRTHEPRTMELYVLPLCHCLQTLGTR